RHYAERGYITCPHLLSVDEVESARAALGQVMHHFLADARAGRATYKPPAPGGTGNYDGAWISRADNRAALLFEHSYDALSATARDDEILARVRKAQFYETEHPLFAEMVESPRIKGVAEELLGEEAVLFQTMALVKPALIGSEKPWHQDNAYFKYAPLEGVVGFWVALDDASAENG